MHNQDVFLEQTLLEEGRVTAEQLEEARRYGIEHSEQTFALPRQELSAGEPHAAGTDVYGRPAQSVIVDRR